MQNISTTALAAISLALGVGACGNAATTPDAGDVDAGTADGGADASPGDAGTDAGPPPMTTTACGAVIGTRSARGVQAYLGIPYAAPPVGPLRFKPPAAASCWTAPRDATHFGPYCPQMPSTLLPLPGVGSEDCLTVNVWAPDPMPSTPVPVMFWMYGGGFTIGGTSDPLYEGSKLAARGVVVVSINYRVGALGWMAHSALATEDAHGSTGDYGLLDQIAGLHWVHDNAAAFGGDATKVTIFGESAGGISVCSLIGSPLADGLYARAIVESGSCVTPVGFPGFAPLALAQAETRGATIAAALGCTTGDIPACLRGKTVDEILAAQPMLNLAGGTLPLSPVVDGYALPVSTRARLMDPTFTPVPLVVGTNHDEATLFDMDVPLATFAEYEAFVTTNCGAYASGLLSVFPSSDFATPKEAFDTGLRDAIFTCPARLLARLASVRQPHTFLYQFSQANNFELAFGYGVTHGGELAFVWGNFVRPFLAPTMDERVVLAEMQGDWVRFAGSGDPNGGTALTWPAFTSANDSRLELATPTTVETALETARCDALDALPAP